MISRNGQPSGTTNIDKFSYLILLLESTAAEAIAGLKLTSANYEEAVATLKRRFGNKQLIVNRHMDRLLQLESVTLTDNLKGLRRLFDAVESNIRKHLLSFLWSADCWLSRVILDTGSQRSYVTTRVRGALGARKLHTELMVIKTFGSDHGQRRDCDIVQLKFATKQGNPVILPMVVVPHICDSVCSQPIDTSKAAYKHLAGLDLADAGRTGDSLEINLLIGSDHYWKLVTGRVLKRRRTHSY